MGQGVVWEIDNGWDVYGADGDKIGDVHDVQPHYITVSKGFFFPTERYIPVSAIANVEHDRVYLGVTKSEIESRGWDVVPDDDGYGSTSTGTGFTERTSSREYADAGLTDRTMRDEHLRVPVAEERLEVEKQQVERGSVRVHKDVVEEQQTVDVPLREEEIRVERHAARGEFGSGDVPADAFEETTYEIPIRGEEVDVSKRAVVREEIDISKDVRERTEHVSDTVRREEVHIDGTDTDVTRRDR
jgi:uncharacterized protein (TIGR02271 family)